jgi:hypothetical protein
MKNQNGVLPRLVQILVDEWGYDRVAQELSRVNRFSDISLPSRRSRNGSAKRRLNPTEQVQKMPLESGRREALLRLAKRYEERQFLPNVAAVREFLSMAGYDPGPMKDRDQAFRTLLLTLLQLPTERLNQLTHSSLHSGPSQLGPISDAIAAAGEQMPRRAHPSDTSSNSEHEVQKF